MKLLKRNRATQQEQHHWTDAVAVRLFSRINKMQSGFASFMHRKLNHLSVQKQKTVLVIFVVLTASISGYYIVKGIWPTAPNINPVKIEQINFPRYDQHEDKERII